MADKFYTTGQAAAAIGVSRQTLQTWIAEGKVSAPKMIGNTRVWSQSQVNKLKKVPRGRSGKK
jgi:excisionase family DNA binding protein